jgi:uncharacterized protein (TIGR02680 family)
MPPRPPPPIPFRAVPSEISNLKSEMPSGSDAPPAAFPAPRRERWQPLRSGVLNLYRYDDEEFHYADGRLLLRGNNGSGKSRVLALQLPFLLDGEVTPARVEPDGDAAKRIEWNLLMGRHKDRTGYTWIEFGRREPDGTERFVTLGCGLRAVEGHTGLHSRWFFVTPRRIGRDLALTNEQRIPLGPARLTEVLGDGGRVFHKAEDYRRAVDEALFGLGPRYGALIDLLLRLRRPQLTRKLDENELPEALSEALPTLSAAIVEEVAESFRGLQADKDTLRDFAAARDAVAHFLREYAGYLRIAVRRRAADLRTANSGYEAAQRSAKDAQARLDAATAALEALATAKQELDLRLAGAEADERALAASPEMKTAGEIHLAEEAANTAAKTLAQAQADLAAAAGAVALAEWRLRQTDEATARFASTCRTALARAEAAARDAALSDLHRPHAPPADATELPDLRVAPAAERTLSDGIAQRLRAIKHLRSAEAELATRAAALAAADQTLRDAQTAVATAREDEHTARETLATRAAALADHYATWQATARHLQPPAPSTVAEAFATWLERRAGASPFRAAAETAHLAATTALASRETELRRAIAELDSALQQLAAEISRLDHGDAPPPPPLTRRAERRGRAGAPLWQVCDFRADLAPAERAGLEAALQASGLLDAWLTPDGRLLSAEEDTFIVVAADVSSEISNLRSQIRPSLADVLLPAIDPESPAARDLSAELVERTLARIGATPDAGEHWVARDGSWRLGPLAGRWSKPEPEYVGEATRAAARRRQLEQLRARETETAAERARRAAELAALDDARPALAAEFAATPSDEPVRHAGYALETAVHLHSTRILEAEKAGRAADARRAEHDEAQAKLRTDAADLGLDRWLGRLEALSETTQAYATTLASLWPTLRHAETLAAQLAQLREQHALAETAHLAHRARHEGAASEAAAAQRRFETLRDTHGKTVAEVLARHAAARVAVENVKAELKTNETQRIARTADQSAAQAQFVAANEKRETQEATRRQAIARLRELAEHRLLAEAAPAVPAETDAEPWSAKHAVELARALDAALTDAPLDADAWHQRQDQIHGHIQELRDRLVPHGHQPETHQLDELVLVRCLFQAREHTMTELHAAFAAEIDARERLLREREREIIENHLLAEAAVELQRLIRAAEAWRADANTELHSRPTSSGVRFRFQWEANQEIRFHEIRPILLRKGELWTPSDRAAVAAFLQGRIAAEQAADESGSWRDHLARALDYRRWHRFVIERQQDGQWRRLNKTTYGTGSGGEKALALTLPRFAAAAAHYRGASKLAPRLVMLDEAFAGIDPTMRAQCLGVIAQFDLDVVMTSELEWGCYATVPALAIYHLTTLPGVDAVASTRWLWNGREARQIDHAPPPEPSGDADLKFQM